MKSILIEWLLISLHKKWCFPLRISLALVNVTKSAGNWKFGHITVEILNGKLQFLWRAYQVRLILIFFDEKCGGPLVSFENTTSIDLMNNTLTLWTYFKFFSSIKNTIRDYDLLPNARAIHTFILSWTSNES